MAEDKSLVQRRSFHEDILAFLDVITAMLAAEQLLADTISMAGYDVSNMDSPDLQGETAMDKVVEVMRSVRTSYESLREHWPEKIKSWEAVKDLLGFAADVFEEYKRCKGIFALAAADGTDDGEGTAGKIALDVLEQIILRGHAILFPPSIQLYRLLGWVMIGEENEAVIPVPDTSGNVVRYPFRGIRFNGTAVNAFRDDPGKALKDLYFPTLPPGTIARTAAPPGPPDDLLLVRLRDLLLSFGLPASYGLRMSDELSLDDNQVKQFSKTLSTWFHISDNIELGISLRRDGANMIVTPTVTYLDNTNPAEKKFDRSIGDWHWTFNMGGNVGAFVFGADGVHLPPSFTAATTIAITATKGTNDAADPAKNAPAYVIGTDAGTRLELGKMDINLLLNLNTGGSSADLKFRVSQSGFYLVPGDGDGFLKKILPEKGVAILFDVTLGYSNLRGFYVDGGAGGEILIPVNKKLGKVTLPSIQLGFGGAADLGRWSLYATLNGRTELGPVTLTLDKTGIQLLLNKPAAGAAGNLGILDADFDFKPPYGVGVEINVKNAVSGGGYLYYDAGKGEYFGAASLSFKNKYKLKAFGIIQTRVPGGASGFSFLLIASVEFAAIPLPLGFALTGLGGIVGIHRRVDMQKLRDGIYANDIDDMLFPKDPLKDVYGLITRLNGFFPAADNQFTIGLTAMLTWGEGLVNIKLALIFEFNDSLIPSQIFIVGVIQALVKKKFQGKEFTALQLQINFFTVIDFDKQLIALDAHLYQSKLLGMKLEGDMALRIKYGDNPDFLLTVGGFHPRFQPPALDLPANIQRLQIVLRSGNPSITVGCYIAITTNTLQFGVAGLFVYTKWGVGIRGELSFDALFQFSPFRFETDLHFELAASWKGYDFASIKVDGTFSGPSPWNISGSLKLHVWIFSKTVSLNETWGDDDETQLESIRILPLIIADLQRLSSWESIAGRTTMSVSLRKSLAAGVDADGLTIHPNDLLAVRQSVVPLGIRIDKFGSRKPQGARLFSLSLQKGDVTIPALTVKNHFAAGQFVNFSNEEQLSAPPYQLLDSGLSLQGLDAVVFDDFFTQPFEYEAKVEDDLFKTVAIPLTLFTSVQGFLHSIQNNSTANSSGGKAAMTKTKAPAAFKEMFVIANQNGQQLADAGALGSQLEVWQRMNELKKKDIYNRTSLSIQPLVPA